MITILDWPIALLYLTIILVIGWYWSKKYSGQVKKVFFWGLVAHLLGGLAFAFIYEFYYGGGDTFYYFSGGQKFIGVLFENPGAYLELLFTSYDNVTIEQSYYVQDIQYFRSNELWLMVRITSVFAFFGIGQFLPTTILFSLLGFLSNWLIYLAIKDFFKEEVKYLFLIMFLPSVLFWGNGIMKDTVVFLAVGLSFYTFSLSVNEKVKNPLTWYALIIFSLFLMYMTLTLKSYVVGVFLICFIVALFQHMYRQINVSLIRITFTVLSLAIFIGILYFLQQTVTSTMMEAQEEAISTLRGFHSWHTERGGSTYSLGEIDYTLWGILSKTPSALIVTFFRPYLWEVSSPFMLLTFVESVFFLLLLVYSIYDKIKYKKRSIKLFKNSLFLFAFLFVVIFGFVVGLTSYNFGALARYKLVCLPFYVGVFLMFINSKTNLINH